MTNKVQNKDSTSSFPFDFNIPSKKASTVVRSDLDIRIQSVINRFKGKNTPEELIAGFNKLIKEDTRFNGSDSQFFFAPEVISAFQNTVNLISKKKISPKSIKEGETEVINPKLAGKIKSKLAPLLMQFVDRRSTLSNQFPNANGRTFIMTEQHGYFENKSGRHVQQSESAEVQKKSEAFRTANLGWITLNEVKNGKQTAERVILSRSARTTTIDKILEKSRTDIMARLTTTEKTGLEEVKDKSGHKFYRYTRVDVTFMDSSPIKSLLTRIHSRIWKRSKVSEDERAFLKSKRDAIAKFWSEGNRYLKKDLNGVYFEHNLRIKRDNGETEVIKVREYKPIIFNHLLSSQAKRSSEVDRARESNVENIIQMFKPFIKKCGLPNIAHAIDLYEESKSSKNFENLKYIILKGLKDPKIEKDAKALLEDFYFELTGENFPNLVKSDPTYESARHLMILGKYANLSNKPISVECKSGNDRTATAIGIACAQVQFRMVFGREFILLPKIYQFKTDDERAEYESDLQIFKDLFTNYILHFGKSTVLASRGKGEDDKPILKTASSPVFRMFADTKRLEKEFTLE